MEDDTELWDFLHSGISKSTLSQYERYWSLWQEYLNAVGSADIYLQSLSERKQSILVVRFIMILHNLRKYSKSKITNVISALQHMFRIRFYSVQFLKLPVVLLAKRSCKISGRKNNLLREKHKRLPITSDMIEWLCQMYWGKDVDKCMIYIAIALAYNFMWRTSEYIFSPSNPHALLAEDVEFVGDNNIRIKPWQVKNSSIMINSAILVIRSSKSDDIGKGRYLYLNRTSLELSGLLDKLIIWCNISFITHDDPFMCRYLNGRRKLLTSKMVADAIKTMASSLGFPKNLFSSHSLRIGGATTMRAAGVARDVIKKIGGWGENSNCDLIYDRNTANDVGALSIGNKNSNRLSINDIQHLVPLIRKGAN